MADDSRSDDRDSRDDDRGRRGGSGGKFGKFSRSRRPQVPEQPLEYKNIEYLSKFIGPTGKIVSRRRTGFSGQDQRRLASAIKLARFIGLLPYTGVASGDSSR